MLHLPALANNDSKRGRTKFRTQDELTKTKNSLLRLKVTVLPLAD